ncbi:MAG: hypothetical protein IJE68_00025 [Clostridia bacterium]|nr:hypothetical protein [Clostridia bacterium]
MKRQDGKTPLTCLVTIAVLLIIGGAVVAMLFEGTDIVKDIKGMMEKNNIETVQDDEKIS